MTTQRPGATPLMQANWAYVQALELHIDNLVSGNEPALEPLIQAELAFRHELGERDSACGGNTESIKTVLDRLSQLEKARSESADPQAMLAAKSSLVLEINSMFRDTVIYPQSQTRS